MNNRIKIVLQLFRENWTTVAELEKRLRIAKLPAKPSLQQEKHLMPSIEKIYSMLESLERSGLVIRRERTEDPRHERGSARPVCEFLLTDKGAEFKTETIDCLVKRRKKTRAR